MKSFMKRFGVNHRSTSIAALPLNRKESGFPPLNIEMAIKIGAAGKRLWLCLRVVIAISLVEGWLVPHGLIRVKQKLSLL